MKATHVKVSPGEFELHSKTTRHDWIVCRRDCDEDDSGAGDGPYSRLVARIETLLVGMMENRIRENPNPPELASTSDEDMQEYVIPSMPRRRLPSRSK